MIIIPTFQKKSSKFRQDIILGNASLTLVCNWSIRSNAWFIDLFNDTCELKSKKLVANWPLIRRNRASFPCLTGDIIAIKTDFDAGGEITYDNLNDGWALYYLDQFELVEWETANGV